MPATSRPTPLLFDCKGRGTLPFPEAVLFYMGELGLNLEDTAAVLAEADEELGLVNHRTVWRWTRGPEHRWRQVPDLLKQRRIIKVLRARWARRRRR